MKFMMILCIGYFSLGLAQETCESLLEGLEQTLAQTQSLERETTIKAGVIELASVAAVVKRTPSGLEVTETGRSGRQLTDRPGGAGEAEAGWFGPFDSEIFSCEGHSLKQTAKDRYELDLVDSDDATLPEDFGLRFRLEGERFVLEMMHSKVKAPGLPVNPTMTVTFGNWVFTGAE